MWSANWPTGKTGEVENGFGWLGNKGDSEGNGVTDVRTQVGRL